jgi:ribosomal protein L32
MLIKLLITGGIVIGALMAFRLVGRAADTKMDREEERARDTVRRKLKGEDYVKCEDCGNYTARTDVCACKT